MRVTLQKEERETTKINNPLFWDESVFPEKGNFTIMHSEEIVKKYVPAKTRKRTSFEEHIYRESNFAVLRYLMSHLDLRRINKVLLSYSHDFSSKNLIKNVKFVTQLNNIHAVVDLKKVNENRNLRDYFAAINEILPGRGIYFGCVETHRQRNRRIQNEHRKIAAFLIILYEFVFHRVIPKISLFRNWYLQVSGGKIPVLSLGETLGRLVYAGFDIIEYKSIRNLTYFVVMKTRPPAVDRHPMGFFNKIRKTGKNGRTYNIIGLRTRHIFSEYLDDHVLKLNGRAGEANVKVWDFRYNVLGRILYGEWRTAVFSTLQAMANMMVGALETLREIRLLPRLELEDIFFIKYSLGKGGKPIRIYKFRTMVKNADKMDNLIVQYDSYGNPIKDPRITSLGRFMRKVWIDELPQLFSILKGDIKLVGIRPMRESDWERYPKELKERALQFKPGLMGVQYATLRQENFEEHIRFFHKYLDMKERRPFLTDFYFFFRILYYIFFKGVRSD
jgi:lipopolysaccharide/colanic/teichoic acid biosynthesis glycosyltransferase